MANNTTIGSVGVDVELNFGEFSKEVKKLEKQIAAIEKKKIQLSVDSSEFKNLDSELKKLEKRKTKVEIRQDDIENTKSGLTNLIQTVDTLNRKKITIGDFGNKISNMGDKLLGVFKPLTSSLSSITSMVSQGLGFATFASIATRAINSVNQGLDNAILRYDTLNNSQRVFENMGIEATVVTTEIGNLNDAILGLPTSLDSAIRNVQLLTSANQDMSKSVKIYQAVNDAVLGFGGSTAQADNAVLQLSQDMAGGRIYAATWNSLLNSGLGPTLNAIAKEMGMTTTGLKESLSDGSVSVDQFTDALIRMDEEGGGGMKSLQTIVKDATKGISTSASNAKTAISRGFANLIESVDKALEQSGFGGISGVIVSFGSALEGYFSGLGKFVEKHKDTIGDAMTFIGDKVGALFAIITSFDFESFISGFVDGVGLIIGAFKTLLELASPIFYVIEKIISTIGGGDFAKGLGRTAAGVLALGIAFKSLGFALKTISKIKNFGLPSFGKGSSSGSGSIGNLGGLTSLKDNLSNVASSFVKNLSSIALIAASAGTLILIAEAIKQLDEKLPDDMESFAVKIGNMSIALAAIGAFVVVAGQLPKDKAFTGLVVVAAMAAELMLVAEAISQLDDKIPRNLDEFKDKLIVMAAAIGSFALIVTVVGGLVATGIGALIAGAGLATVALVAADMMLVAEAIKQLDDKIPSNMGDVTKKLEVIGEVIEFFGSGNIFTALLDLVKHAIQLADYAIIVNMIDQVVDIAKQLRKLQNINLSNNKIKKNINSVNDSIELLGDDRGIIGGILNLFDNSIDTKYYAKAKETISNIVSIANKLRNLQTIKLTKKTIENKINAIKASIDKIGELDFSEVNIDTDSFEKAEIIASNLVSAAKSFDDLESITVDVDVIVKKITDLGSMLEALARLEYSGMLGNVKSEKYEETKKSIDNIIEIVNSLTELMDLRVPGSATREELDMGILPKDLSGKVTEINEMLKQIALIDFSTALSVRNSENFEQVVTSINHIQEIIEKVNELIDLKTPGKVTFDIEKGFGAESLTKKIEDIQKVLNAIGGITFNATSAVAKKDTFNQVVNSLKQIQDIMLEVSNLMNITVPGKVTFDIEKGFGAESLTKKIESIQVVLNKIGTINLDEMGSLGDSSSFEEIKSSLEKLDTIIANINEIGTLPIDNAGVDSTVENMKTAFTKISELSLDEKFSSITLVLTQVKNLATELNNLVTSFEETGVSYGKSMIDGFTESEFAGAILTMIETLVTNLGKKITAFKDIGKRYGSNIKDGFSEGVSGLQNVISSQLINLFAYSTSFTALGASYGDSFLNGFTNAVANVGSTISGITSGSGRSNALPFSTGGIVPEYHSEGGLAGVFTPKGTDTVPAMLTPKEFVMKRESVKYYGTDFMKNINNGDLLGALRSITGNHIQKQESMTNATISKMKVDNTYNNQKMTYNDYSKSQRNNTFKRVSRTMRGIA